MIILAPETGLMIAGSLLFNVNTRESGSRYKATEFGMENVRATPGKSNGWTTIKRSRGQGAGNTPTALTQPLPKQPEGGQAVQKPMAPAYRLHGGPAATSERQSVQIMTVLVVD